MATDVDATNGGLRSRVGDDAAETAGTLKRLDQLESILLNRFGRNLWMDSTLVRFR
jgi:hypothetical protein